MKKNKKGPDFVGVGFPKCGTTFLYDNIICNHPEVMHLPKERHCFSDPFKDYSERDYQSYRSLFDYGKVCGEFSPGILYKPLHIKFLAEAVPNTKILVMVRNPIDRMFSHMKQMMDARIRNISPNDPELLVESCLYPEAYYSGLYDLGIEKLLKYYNEDQIHLIQYEMLQKKPGEIITHLFQFLGLSGCSLSPNIKEPDSYSKFQHFRPHLQDYYQDNVDNLMDILKDCNIFYRFDFSLWGDFN